MHPYAVVRDIAASWTTYPVGTLAAADGLLLRAAGVTDDGYRVIDVWESEAAWVRHCAAGGVPTGTELSSAPVVRGLHVRHIVIGNQSANPPHSRRDSDA